MKISNIRPGALDIYKTQKDKTREQQIERGTQEQDRAEISPRGQELQKYLEVLNKMPDIRTERVQELKKSIAGGTYKPSAEQTAEKIISERRLDTRR